MLELILAGGTLAVSHGAWAGGSDGPAIAAVAGAVAGSGAVCWDACGGACCGGGDGKNVVLGVGAGANKFPVQGAP